MDRHMGRRTSGEVGCRCPNKGTRAPFPVGACLWVPCLMILLFACSEKQDPPTTEPSSAAFSALFESVFGYHFDHVPILPDGDTVGDFGDSTGYGSAALFTLAYQTGREDYREVARKMAGREALLLQDLSWLLNIVEVYIGTVGSFKAYEFTQEEAYRNTVERVLDLFNPILENTCDVIFLIDEIPYGPTTIVGGVAMYNLQYAFSIGETSRTAAYIDQGLDLIRRIDTHAYQADERYYRYAKRNDTCSAYPNSIMIIALCRAYQVTGNERYIERARAVAETVEARLLDETSGGYYGAEGSEEAYMALSNQNYIIQALLFLAEVTGEATYLSRANRTIAFVKQYLCEPEEGICYHDLRLKHRMDWFCSGCNWQLLYNILEYRRILSLVQD